MNPRFELRHPSAELADQYRRSGLWTDCSLAQALEAGLSRNRGTEFRVWSDIRPCKTTWGDIHQRSMRVAAGFRRLGVGPGDVVSFQLPNWVEAIETFLAATFLGAAVVPIVQIYGAKELKFILADSGARLHVTTSSFRNFQYRDIIDDLRPQSPRLESVVYLDADWTRLLSHDPISQPYRAEPDAPAVIGYTSGTTADPKGVIHTSRTVLAEIRQRHTAPAGDDRAAPLNPPKGYDAWLTASPIGHVSGLQTALLLPILLDRRAGMIDQWDVEKVLEALVDGDLHLAAAATFFFNSMLAHHAFRSEHIQRMKYVVSGGAPVPRAFGEMCELRGIKLVRGYGSTEHPTVIGSAFDDPTDKRIGTDGRFLAGVEIELRDGAGRQAPIGVAGEIFSRGPDLFAGYTNAQLTREAIDNDGWFASGDVGVMDADGYITITDRIKDIIIRGGENISAAEVEGVLAKMEGVLEAAAVAAPDERFGERVCAFLRLRQGSAAPNLVNVREFLAGSGLAKQKWPEEIKIVDEFERTASGKIKKFKLRDCLRRDASLSEGMKLDG